MVSMSPTATPVASMAPADNTFSAVALAASTCASVSVITPSVTVTPAISGA